MLHAEEAFSDNELINAFDLCFVNQTNKYAFFL